MLRCRGSDVSWRFPDRLDFVTCTVISVVQASFGTRGATYKVVLLVNGRLYDTLTGFLAEEIFTVIERT